MTRVLCFIRPRSPRRLYKLILTSFLLATYLLASKLSQNCELKPFSSSAINFTQHNVNQNEMKFIAFFAFVATVSATTVQFNTEPNCSPDTFVGRSYDQCGKSFNMEATAFYAYITQDGGKGVDFYADRGCPTGGRSKTVKEDQCFSYSNLAFSPKCFIINC